MSSETKIVKNTMAKNHVYCEECGDTDFVGVLINFTDGSKLELCSECFISRSNRK